jgi:hypothetical protein
MEKRNLLAKLNEIDAMAGYQPTAPSTPPSGSVSFSDF